MPKGWDNLPIPFGVLAIVGIIRTERRIVTTSIPGNITLFVP